MGLATAVNAGKEDTCDAIASRGFAQHVDPGCIAAGHEGREALMRRPTQGQRYLCTHGLALESGVGAGTLETMMIALSLGVSVTPSPATMTESASVSWYISLCV